MALVAGDEPGGPIGSEWPVLWIVWRRDDNGNRFEVARKDSHAEAEALAAAGLPAETG